MKDNPSKFRYLDSSIRKYEGCVILKESVFHMQFIPKENLQENGSRYKTIKSSLQLLHSKLHSMLGHGEPREKEKILYFETFYLQISEISILVLKMPLFLSNFDQFSVRT